MTARVSRMPFGMVAIATLAILAFLAYLLATGLSAAGLLQAPVDLETRVLGIVMATLWLLCAMCIIMRLRWGGAFCISLFILGLVLAVARGVASGFTVWSLSEILFAFACGVYFFMQRDYFRPVRT